MFSTLAYLASIMMAVILFVMLFMFLVISKGCMWALNKIRKKPCIAKGVLEKELLDQYPDADISGRWVDIPVRGAVWPVRYQSTVYRDDRPCLVLIHGLNSGSLMWLPVWSHLQEKYNIIALDLPGFGFSPCPAEIQATRPEQIAELYVTFLQAFFECLRLPKAFLLGHSFGGYVALAFADKYPERVQKLLLASPAGLLPTLEVHSAYVGMFWILSPIMQPLRGFSLPSSPDRLYWDEMYRDGQTCRGAIFHILVKWNKLTGTFQCRYPLFHKLLTLKVPLAFIYGIHDAMTPVHQGRVLASLLNSDIPVVEINHTGHALVDAPPEVLFTGIDSAFENAVMPLPLTCNVDENYWLQFQTGFDTRQARGILKNMYSDLQARCRFH